MWYLFSEMHSRGFGILVVCAAIKGMQSDCSCLFFFIGRLSVVLVNLLVACFCWSVVGEVVPLLMERFVDCTCCLLTSLLLESSSEVDGIINRNKLQSNSTSPNKSVWK